jgi:hypothetical protein
MKQPSTQQFYKLLNHISHGNINYSVGYYQCCNSHQQCTKTESLLIRNIYA